MEGSSRSGTLEVPGGHLAYEIAGQGPPLMFVHASIADRRMWGREFATYSGQWTVVRYDLRGCGKSGGTTGPFSYADDLFRLWRHLKLPRATLVGCSMGGRIAIDVALEHPEVVRSLLLAAPGLSAWSPELDPDGVAVYERDGHRSAEITAIWAAGHSNEAVDRLQEYWCSAQTGENLELTRKMMWDNRTEIFTEATERQGRALSPGAAGRLESIRVPTTVLLGDRDVPTMGYIVRRAAAGIPGAALVLVPGADHLINLSRPEEFDSALRALLAR